MTYFYKCEKCFSQTKIETDDEQFANKRIAHFKKYHNCNGKTNAKTKSISEIPSSLQMS
jgi:hypothetical protein